MQILQPEHTGKVMAHQLHKNALWNLIEKFMLNAEKWLVCV